MDAAEVAAMAAAAADVLADALALLIITAEKRMSGKMLQVSVAMAHVAETVPPAAELFTFEVIKWRITN